MECIFDPGMEFKAHFRQCLARHGIVPKPTSEKNPRANAICERVRQTAGDVLRVQQHLQPPQTVQEANQIIENVLATASCAARTAVHSTMKISPGASAFHRDMLLNTPITVDLQPLQQWRQALIDHNLMIANQRRISHDCQPNDQVVICMWKPDKLDPHAIGPFTINRVHTNGTVAIQCFPNIEERINIRRVRPCRTQRSSHPS